MTNPAQTHNVEFDSFRLSLTEFVSTAYLNAHLSEAFTLWLVGYPVAEVGRYLLAKRRDERR